MIIQNEIIYILYVLYPVVGYRGHRNEGPLVGTQGYQRFPLSMPGVGQIIALHAAPADGSSTYLVSAFLIRSTSSFPQTFPIISSESEFGMTLRG